MSFPSKFVEFFGPCMWKVMHSVAFTYPEQPGPETRREYIDFYRSIGNVIPCPSCRTHYNKYLEENPIDGDDRESLARWVYDLHSSVNQRNKKPNPSFEDVEQAYTGWTPESDRGKSKQRIVSELADPHFGGRLTGMEKALGMDQQESSIMRTVLIIMAVLFIYVMFRRVQKRNQENQ